MINELINSIKQAYRDIETGSEVYRQRYAATAAVTPQVLDDVEPPAPLPNPGMPQPDMGMPQQPQAPRPALLDILSAKAPCKDCA